MSTSTPFHENFIHNGTIVEFWAIFFWNEFSEKETKGLKANRIIQPL